MESGVPVERITGFPTHVARMGAGVRRALFIHCTLAHSGAWNGVAAVLLDKLAMTAFDRPGHGRSGPWTGGEDARGLHDLTTRIAGQLIDRRADVIGHSFGATVALRLAMERPEQVRRLVLIEPVMFAAIKTHPAFAEVEDMLGRVRAAIDAGDATLAARTFNDAVNPELPFDGLDATRQASMVKRVDLVLAESGVTLYDAPGLLAPGRIEKIKQPVLLLESGSPPRGVRDVHEAICARLPHVQRVVIVGAGHMSPLTHPVNVAGEIATFLKI